MVTYEYYSECFILNLTGEYRFDCTTNCLTGVDEGQEIDRMKVISLDELDNAIRGQSGSQGELASHYCSSVL